MSSWRSPELRHLRIASSWARLTASLMTSRLYPRLWAMASYSGNPDGLCADRPLELVGAVADSAVVARGLVAVGKPAVDVVVFRVAAWSPLEHPAATIALSTIAARASRTFSTLSWSRSKNRCHLTDRLLRSSCCSCPRIPTSSSCSRPRPIANSGCRRRRAGCTGFGRRS